MAADKEAIELSRVYVYNIPTILRLTRPHKIFVYCVFKTS